MLQRIQSLYLLMASIISIGLPQFIYLWKDSQGNPFYVVDGFYSEMIYIKIMSSLFFISGLLSLIAIGMFKNRQNQFVTVRINILINLIIIGLLIYVSLSLPGEMGISKKGIGLGLPFIIIALLAITNKAIKRDEELVKSVDRLR